MYRSLVVAACLAASASAAFAQNGFDIKTIDPENFRAIAFKITDAQKPDIDGRLNAVLNTCRSCAIVSLPYESMIAIVRPRPSLPAA